MKNHRRVLVAGHADDPIRVTASTLASWEPYSFAGLYRHIPHNERLIRDEIDIVLSGLNATREFLRRYRGRAGLIKATLLVLAIDQDELPHALDIVADCDGIVFVDANFTLVKEILRLTEYGLASIPARLVPALIGNQPRRLLLKSLTYRELKVLVLVGRTLTSDQIAARLEISPSIARNIVRSVLWKLRLRNRTEVAIFLHQQSRLHG